jgi:hypothetical protein
MLVKFIYSEKATNVRKISTVDLSYVVMVKSTVEILQNFVAFSEYMNFTAAVVLEPSKWIWISHQFFPFSQKQPMLVLTSI